jgi:5-methylthioadenosine/S-adenosylhomocysteine deaminase
MPKANHPARVKPGRTKPPIDPGEGRKLALAGEIVTMGEKRRIFARGVVFIEKGAIVAVQDKAAAPPPGFESTPVTDTKGTIFPGLIELHNHLSYNLLRLWDVPKKYGNRGQWAGIPEYRSLISGPMKVLGQRPDLLAAMVRYVECKCLLAGVTTSQGIELFSNKGARRFYRGIVRNVEQTSDPNLPEAGTRIPDVDARDAASFLARLAQKKCFLLHLAEGVDETARRHFLSLQFKPGEWAISPSLAGIHCTGLQRPDFDVMVTKGASMIWSPLSNLLLYGDTAKIAEARAAGVRIGLGSDWSPSGSKNLLGELKVARLFSQNAKGMFHDREIVQMATTNAAAILHWEDRLGSIEAGKCADLLVLHGKSRDPYAALMHASERSIQLILINGVPRCGTPALMKKLGITGESCTVGGEKRTLNLAQATADPDVAPISLKQARKALTKALHDLPKLKLSKAAMARRAAFDAPLTWFLALDELGPTGMDVRPHLPFGGRPTMAAAKGPDTSKAGPPVLRALELDPLTVADDEDFLERIAKQKNPPSYLREGLPLLYR